MPKRKTLTLSDRAADLLPQLAGVRDQGAYVSQLIESIVDAAAEEQTLALLTDADLAVLRDVVRQLVLDVSDLKRSQQKKP